MVLLIQVLNKLMRASKNQLKILLKKTENRQINALKFTSKVLVVLYLSPKRMKKIKVVGEFILQETYVSMHFILRKVPVKH
jgi:hypothetical protein